MNFIDKLPHNLQMAYAVSGFRGSVTVKRPLLESLYNVIAPARLKSSALSGEVASWFDTMEGTRAAFDDPAKKEKIWELGPHSALISDAASTMLLIAASELDRLHQKAGISLFERGQSTYVATIRFSRATYALANQYKHLGKWRHNERNGGEDRKLVQALVDDPLREDAAAEFLLRGYATYDPFEAALLSCSDGIVTDGTIPETGRAGLPTITMRLKKNGAQE